MNDNLPPSLDRFAAQLEQAICRELTPGRDRRPGRMLRWRPRLLLGSTIGAVAIGAVLAIALSVTGSSPAFAITRNRDGSYSVTLRSLSAIAAANRKLSQMGVHAVLVQGRGNCPTEGSVRIPAEQMAIKQPAPIPVCGPPPLPPRDGGANSGGSASQRLPQQP